MNLSTSSSSSRTSSSSLIEEESRTLNSSAQGDTHWMTAPLRFFGKLLSICWSNSSNNKSAISKSNNNTVSDFSSFHPPQEKEKSSFFDHTAAITDLVYGRNQPGKRDEYHDLLEETNSLSNIASLQGATAAVNACQRLLNHIEDAKDASPSRFWRKREQMAMQKLGEVNEILTRYLVEERNNQDYEKLKQEIPNPENIFTLEKANQAVDKCEKLLLFIERAENTSPEKPTYPWETRKKEAMNMLEVAKKNQKIEKSFEKHNTLDEERKSDLTEPEGETPETKEPIRKNSTSPITVQSLLEEEKHDPIDDNSLLGERDKAVADFNKSNTNIEKFKRRIPTIPLSTPLFRPRGTSASLEEEDDKIQ